MKKEVFIYLSAFAALSLVLGVGFKKHSKPAVQESKLEEQGGYYTCSMHPQVHLDHPGECPICHMNLIHVKTSKATETAAGRSAVFITSNQMLQMGIQKTQVGKMDLTVRIPASGRMLSSGTVSFQVYESDLRYLKAGVKFQGTIASRSDESVSGVVSSIDSLVDPQSRTVRVIGFIAKSLGKVLPEMSFHGEFLVLLKDRISIPENSVLHSGVEDLVYFVNPEGKFSPKSVSLGAKAEGYYEVLTGLNEGDTISAGPNFFLDSEARIRGSGGQ